MEFNSLSTYDKLVYLLEDAGTVVDIDIAAYQVEFVADAIDRMAEKDGPIKLVEFLSEKDRARGCRWCGG